MDDDATSDAQIRAFLIADIRGYTSFTHRFGDEAGARLATRFAEVVAEVVGGLGGGIVELRGDEALCVFASPRQALRSAAALQRRFADEMRLDPGLPLRVGIGVDAGEAVAVDDGFRGEPLNMAARLCSIALAGEVLVSDGIVHLARKVDDMIYVDRGTRQLKGFDRAVRVHQLTFALDLPEPVADSSKRRVRWPVLVAVAVGIVILAAAIGVWNATRSGRPAAALRSNAVGKYDASGRLDEQISLGGRPLGVAASARATWVTLADRNSVTEVDPATNAVIDTVPVGAVPTGVAVGGGAVWVANSGANTVSWISAAAPSDRLPLTIAVGEGPAPIAYGFGGAWVVNTTDCTLQRIDRTTRKPLAHAIALGGVPSAVAAGAGDVWVTDSASGAVVQIDPRSHRVVARVRVGADPVAVTVGGGHVWVANAGDRTVTVIDPATRLTQTIPVSTAPQSIAYASGAAWVTGNAPGALIRIDPSGTTATTAAQSSPQAVASDGHNLWVTALPALSEHRGGTLTVAISGGDFDSSQPPFEPATSPYAQHWQVLSMTNDGLVGYRRVGGAAGAQVVPDLAVALPSVSDGGRTYTFVLRRGIRYSTGQPVRASDFRYALERDLSPQALSVSSRGYYAGVLLSSVVGYNECHRRPGSCSLAAGIETNDRKRTITVHLTHADPAFLRKLATTVAMLVPPGSPKPNSGLPVPATGPYMVTRIADHDHGFVLVRNPYFREWSAAAQPSGFPDEIAYQEVADPGAALTAVEHGRADTTIDPIPQTRIDELESRYAALSRPYSSLATSYLSMNTHTAPFSSLAVRRAINLAVDRRALVRLLGGAAVVAPTCQILPPGMFGYAPYCPYTANPSIGGGWTAPDLAKARSLVAGSGEAGKQIDVWTAAFSDVRVLGPYFVKLFDGLGFHATLHAADGPDLGYTAWNAALSDPGGRAVAGLAGWIADYPDPSDFFDLLLSCRAYSPNDTSNQNSAGFCDPALDQVVHQAETVPSSNPAKAAELWQQADRKTVDQAPWVSLVNARGPDVVSARVQNYQRHVQWGMLLDQLWIR